jgi:hypothetical protein
MYFAWLSIHLAGIYEYDVLGSRFNGLRNNGFHTIFRVKEAYVTWLGPNSLDEFLDDEASYVVVSSKRMTNSN